MRRGWPDWNGHGEHPRAVPHGSGGSSVEGTQQCGHEWRGGSNRQRGEEDWHQFHTIPVFAGNKPGFGFFPAARAAVRIRVVTLGEVCGFQGPRKIARRDLF